MQDGLCYLLRTPRALSETIVFPDLLSKHLLTLKSENNRWWSRAVEKVEDGSAKLRLKRDHALSKRFFLNL